MRTLIAGLLALSLAMPAKAAGKTKFSSLRVTGTVQIDGKTLAQLNGAAGKPDAVGNFARCTDCTQSALCVSSGTSAGAWVVAMATGTFVGANYSGMPHCR